MAHECANRRGVFDELGRLLHGLGDEVYAAAVDVRVIKPSDPNAARFMRAVDNLSVRLDKINREYAAVVQRLRKSGDMETAPRHGTLARLPVIHHDCERYLHTSVQGILVARVKPIVDAMRRSRKQAALNISEELKEGSAEADANGTREV